MGEHDQSKAITESAWRSETLLLVVLLEEADVPCV